VPDQVIDELLSSGGLNRKGYLRIFRSIVTPKNAKIFVSKLRGRENELSPTIARNVSIAVASSCGRLPQAPGLAAFSAPFAQSAIFVSRSLRRIPKSKRLATAEEIIRASETPAFVAECMRWMSTNGDDEPRLLDPEDEIELRRTAAECILVSLRHLEVPVFLSGNEGAASILNAIQWGLGDERAREYVTGWIEKMPESAISLIRCFKGQGTNLETGLPVETPFFRQQYDPIVSFIDAEKLIKALVDVFGEALSSPPDAPGEINDNLRLANQFIAMRKNVSDHQKTAPAPQE